MLVRFLSVAIRRTPTPTLAAIHVRRVSAMAMEPCPRVLSIQSHVVSGYVGNKSATFPLQVLGFEVDAINTVQFSNHTGYGFWKGQSLTEQDLDDLLVGLSHNGLDESYTHMLTGYNRSKPFLLCVAQFITKLRSKNPKLVYLCDPVMGDIDRGAYVPMELLEVYRDTIIPLANIITPNQFEIELLTGKSVKCVDDAWKAIDVLHGIGPPIVVISSLEVNGESSLYCLGSFKNGNQVERIVLPFAKLPGNFTGTGDLFSALLLAWMWHTKQNLKKSMEYVLATLQAVLLQTTKGAAGNLSQAHRELKLIQSKKDIENPKVEVFAHSL